MALKKKNAYCRPEKRFRPPLCSHVLGIVKSPSPEKNIETEIAVSGWCLHGLKVTRSFVPLARPHVRSPGIVFGLSPARRYDVNVVVSDHTAVSESV